MRLQHRVIKMTKLKTFLKHLRKKNGFTLVELMLVVSIIGISSLMVAQLFHYIFRDYKKVEMRWEIQQEVQYIMSMFTGNAERLSTTTTCSIFDDPEGKMIPKENEEIDPVYSYFWAKPINMETYKSDPENYNDGFDLYYRGRGTSENIKLNAETTHVGIKFNVSTQLHPLFFDKDTGTVKVDSNTKNPQKYVTADYGTDVTEYVTDEGGNHVTDENGVDKTEWNYIAQSRNESTYNKTTLDITVGSSSYYASYYLTSSFNLNNMTSAGSTINFDNGTLTGVWDKSNSSLRYLGVIKHAPFYKAVDGVIQPGTSNDAETISGVSIAGYTDAKANETYLPIKEDEINKGLNKKYNKTGNVLRFISIESFMASDRVSGVSGSALNQSSHCFLTNSIRGSIFEKPVLTDLRAFRDGILSSTAFGKTIISDYYNVISPFFNKKMNTHPLFYKTLGKVVAYPSAIIFKLLFR